MKNNFPFFLEDDETICSRCNGTGESNVCEECGSCDYCGGFGLLKKAGMSNKEYEKQSKLEQNDDYVK